MIGIKARRTERGGADPVPEGSQPLGRGGQSVGVPVETEEGEVGSGLEEEPACPAPPRVASTRIPAGSAGRSRPPGRPSPGGGGKPVMQVVTRRNPLSVVAHLQPPGRQRSSGCLSRPTMTEAGGVGAVHLAGREAAGERTHCLCHGLVASSSSFSVCVGGCLGWVMVSCQSGSAGWPRHAGHRRASRSGRLSAHSALLRASMSSKRSAFQISTRS